jgi:prepilin-type processing-associated H-X9-DG protein
VNTGLVVALAVVGVLIVVGGLLAALLLPAVGAAREAARRASCSNNLKQLALAMHMYHDEYNCFPPAYTTDAQGNPMHSWRVLLLPYIERPDLYNRFDLSKPWDDPQNLAAAQDMPHVFACPSSTHQRASQRTPYQVISGEGMIFNGSTAARLADITDGSSNTLMIVEAEDAAVMWSEPLDLSGAKIQTVIARGPDRINSRHAGGANVCLADGSVRYLSSSISPEILRALMTKGGGETVAYDY